MTLTMSSHVQSFRTNDPAWSDEARVTVQYSLTFGDPDRSITIGERLNKAMEALRNAFLEAAEEDWDGYGAKPPHLEAVGYAWDFIKYLPTSIALPEIAIDVDGDVAIEWDYGRRRILSVRVGRDGTLNYAGMDGYASFYGTESLQESIPNIILNAIERVVRFDRT